MSNVARRVYLDHNATTPLDPRVAAAIGQAFTAWGNPSSVHAEGRAARHIVETARRQVAGALGADMSELVFTASGTEADCLGILGLARLARGAGLPPRALTTPIEHPAVAGAIAALRDDGWETVECRVDADGVIDLDDVCAHVGRGAGLIALGLANHEIGTIQAVAAIAAAARPAGTRVFVDAVQALGKLPISVGELGADALAVSAHKIYGPKGVGALWIRGGVDLAPLAPAGHQERGRRPGTENVAGIAGFGAACDLLGEQLADQPRLAELAAELTDRLLGLGAAIAAHGAPRIATTINARFAGAPGDVIVQALDLAGFAVSTGAACTSGTLEPSPVLLGIGLPREVAREAIRISLGRATTRSELQALLEVLPDIVARARTFA